MNRNPQEEIEEIEEEEDDYVTVPACTVEKVAARPDQRSLCFSQYFLPIAVCWLILLVIMGLRIYYLTAVNQELETERNDLRGQIQNTSQAQWIIDEYCPKVNNDLTAVNQELETERNDLRGQIQNTSQAQWIIDEYCPKVNNERQCKACQKGWRLIKSSCYLVNDADPPDQKTWQEAQDDCRARSSDLVVVQSLEEQDALSFYSWYTYWIGLRAEGGRWKWIDGSYLTESVSGWLYEPPPPTDGQCAASVGRFKWRSVSSAKKIGWICKKKALSV